MEVLEDSPWLLGSWETFFKFVVLWGTSVEDKWKPMAELTKFSMVLSMLTPSMRHIWVRGYVSMESLSGYAFYYVLRFCFSPLTQIEKVSHSHSSDCRVCSKHADGQEHRVARACPSRIPIAASSLEVIQQCLKYCGIALYSFINVMLRFKSQTRLIGWSRVCIVQVWTWRLDGRWPTVTCVGVSYTCLAAIKKREHSSSINGFQCACCL